MKWFKADLHIHTVLSPCGDILMTPQNIINKALEQGLDIIAITDHNSAQNIKVTLDLVEGTSLKVLPGMEVETAEEVHLLCLFDNLEQVLKWQEIVYDSLPDLKNREELFGPQILTDINDEFIGKVDRLLLTATNLSIKQVVDKVNNLGGIVIPSHIDKANNSIIANLGFVPPDLEISALEISKNITLIKAKERFGRLKDYSLIQSSDSHYINDITAGTKLLLESRKLSEISEAIKGLNGRKTLLL